VKEHQNRKLYRQWRGYWWKGVISLAVLAAVLWVMYPIILGMIADHETAKAFEKFKQHNLEYGQFLDENERIMAGLKREE
jgi:hypothetical protein